MRIKGLRYEESGRTEDVEGDGITNSLIKQRVCSATGVYLAVVFNAGSHHEPTDRRPAAVLGRRRAVVVDAVDHLVAVLPPRQARRGVRRRARARDRQRLAGFDDRRT